MLKSIAAVMLVNIDITPRLVQLCEVNRLYRSIAIHKTTAIAAMNTMVKVRFAPVVFAGNNFRQAMTPTFEALSTRLKCTFRPAVEILGLVSLFLGSEKL